ncbi:PREDICTED: uncharacterized protein LOC108612447, partial [Drosophila arizonae]|uniref:Uncharacterized protein LOC108612447 n=1 Tax=Drosophila arizonae TaxID=7263 RepID=A0ABM1P0T3_DROAR
FRHAKAILEKDKIRNTLKDIDNEFDRLQIVLRQEGDEKKKIEQKLSHFSNLADEIKKLQSKVNTINQSFASLDQIKQKFQNSVLSDFRTIFEIEQNILKSLKLTDKLIEGRKVNHILERAHLQQHASQINKLKEREDQFSKASTLVNRLTVLVQITSQQIDSKAVELRCLCNGNLPSNNDFPFKTDFEKIRNLSLEQIYEAILDYQARLDCMKNLNSEVIAEFRHRQAEVEELRKTIEAKSTQEKNLDAVMITLYNKWEPQLTKLIETINKKFSEFMESLSYVGEVILSRKDKVLILILMEFK